MEIVSRKISELKLAEYNPRKITTKEHADLTVSLSDFGMVEPIVVNNEPTRKDVVVGGHQRIRI